MIVTGWYPLALVALTAMVTSLAPALPRAALPAQGAVPSAMWGPDAAPSGTRQPGSSRPGLGPAGWNARSTMDRNGCLYFASGEADGTGSSDIYWTRPTGSGYQAPEPIGPAINTPAREYAPFVSPDGSYLIFAREDRELGVDSFFLSFRTPDGLWTEAIYLREYVPTDGHCLSVSVTPDGAYLLYAESTPAGGRNGAVDAGFIEELRQQVFGYASARSSSPTRR